MQPITTISLLLALVTLISALPSLSPLLPRARMCSNEPKTVAGTKHTRSPGSRFSADLGTNTQTWCDPKSATYLIVSMAYSIPGGAGLPSLLEEVSHAVIGHIQSVADGPILTGDFSFLKQQWGGATMAMHVWNVNNHQVTYGVLEAAVRTLKDFFDSTSWGAATFQIWDGVNEVGLGVVGLQPNT